MLDRYPLVVQTLQAAGRRWELSCVTDQDALMEQVHTDEDLANFPFGMLLWASAEALASRLAQEPTLVAGKRVLELGAGVGFAGLVAAYLGAAQVVQTDYHPDCLALCRSNAALNGISNCTVRTGDWRAWPEELTGFDLVIGADILYERTLHPTLTALLPRLGRKIVLADPLRPAALEFLERREAEGWTIWTEARRLLWAGEWRDTMLLWIEPLSEA
jgi:predicted nicotinamide N-methyase